MTEKIWKPHWATWRHLEVVSLWEGVLLSCDIDPARHTYDPNELEYKANSGDDALRVWTTVERRLLVACRSVREGGRLQDSPYAGHADTRVPLVRFVEWAGSVGWDDMPSELTGVAAEHPSAPGVGRRRHHGRMTDLQKFQRVCRVFLARLLAAYGAAAPTRCAAWLTNWNGWNGRNSGVAETAKCSRLAT